MCVIQGLWIGNIGLYCLFIGDAGTKDSKNLDNASTQPSISLKICGNKIPMQRRIAVTRRNRGRIIICNKKIISSLAYHRSHYCSILPICKIIISSLMHLLTTHLCLHWIHDDLFHNLTIKWYQSLIDCYYSPSSVSQKEKFSVRTQNSFFSEISCLYKNYFIGVVWIFRHLEGCQKKPSKK